MAKNAIKFGDGDEPETIRFGADDQPAAQRDLPTGVKPSQAGGGRGSVSPAPAAAPAGPEQGSPMDSGAGDIMAVAQPGRDSVLEGVTMPEPQFNPAEGERLSLRRNVEVAPPGGPSLSAARPTQSRRMVDQGARLSDASMPVRAVAKAAAGGAEGAFGLVRAGADLAGADGVARFAKESAGAASDFRQGMGESQPVEGFGPKSPLPYLKDMGEGAAASLLTTGAAASLFGARAVIPLLSIHSAGAKYDEARNAGLDPVAALANAVPTGAFEAIGERFQGLDKAAGAIGVLMNKGAGPLARKTAADALVRAGIREIPGEVITYGGQTVVDLLPGIGIRQDLTMGQFLDGLRDTVVQAGMMGTALAGGGTAARRTLPAPSAESLARQKGFLVEDQRIKRLKDAGEDAVAETFQKRLDTARAADSAERELQALQDKPYGADPAFQQRFRDYRLGGMKPAEASARAAMVHGFEQLAGQAGLSPKAMQAATDKLADKPLAEVPGFLDKYVKALTTNGMGAQLPAGTVAEAVRAVGDDAMDTTVSTVYDDTPAETVSAITALEAQVDPQIPAAVTLNEPSASPVETIGGPDDVAVTAVAAGSLGGQATSDGSPGAADDGGDGRVRHAAGAHGFDHLDVDGQAVVKRQVLSAIQNDEVPRSVVERALVPVMDALGGAEGSTDDLLSDKSVFLDRLATAFDDPVLAPAVGLFIDGVATSHPVAFASLGAKELAALGVVKAPSVDGERSAAELAFDGDGSHSANGSAERSEDSNDPVKSGKKTDPASPAFGAAAAGVPAAGSDAAAGDPGDAGADGPDDGSEQPDAALSGQERYGRDGTPLSEGGKPFKKRKDADAARKLRPGTRVLTVKGGFVLADMTPAQLAAQAKAAARLRNPKTSPSGQPIPAHAAIASAGGMSREAMADMGFDKNVRVGNRTLFAGAGKGMTLEQGTQMLIQDGYLPEGASHTDFAELVAKSLKTPQYTPEGWERIGQAETATRFEDHLEAQQEVEDDPFGPIADYTEAELEAAGYEQADEKTQAEVRALLDLADAQGIDTEGIRMDAAAQTSNQSEQAYYEAAKAALEAALARSEGDRSAPAGSEGQAREEGLNGSASLPADRAEPKQVRGGSTAGAREVTAGRREDAGGAADVSGLPAGAGVTRPTAPADDQPARQRSDPADSGRPSSAEPAVTETPADAGVSASGTTKTEPRRRVADLRKRLAVLKALRACVGGS